MGMDRARLGCDLACVYVFWLGSSFVNMTLLVSFVDMAALLVPQYVDMVALLGCFRR